MAGEIVWEERGWTRPEVFRQRYTWTINNFNFYCNAMGSKIESPIFSDRVNNDGLEWFLQINPNGWYEDSDVRYLSLYLHLVSSNISDFEANFKLSILNPKLSEICKFEDTKLFGLEKYHGCNGFFKRSRLLNEKEEIFPDDILTILCEITTVPNFLVVSQKTIEKLLSGNLLPNPVLPISNANNIYFGIPQVHPNAGKPKEESDNNSLESLISENSIVENMSIGLQEYPNEANLLSNNSSSTSILPHSNAESTIAEDLLPKNILFSENSVSENLNEEIIPPALQENPNVENLSSENAIQNSISPNSNPQNISTDFQEHSSSPHSVLENSTTEHISTELQNHSNVKESLSDNSFLNSNEENLEEPLSDNLTTNSFLSTSIAENIPILCDKDPKSIGTSYQSCVYHIKPRTSSHVTDPVEICKLLRWSVFNLFFSGRRLK